MRRHELIFKVAADLEKERDRLRAALKELFETSFQTGAFLQALSERGIESSLEAGRLAVPLGSALKKAESALLRASKALENPS